MDGWMNMKSKFDRQYENLMEGLHNKRRFKVYYGNRHGIGSVQFFTVVDADNEEDARQMVGKSLAPHDVIEKVEPHIDKKPTPIFRDVALEKVNIPDNIYRNCSRHDDVIELHYPDAQKIAGGQTSFGTRNNIGRKSGNCDIMVHDGVVDILRSDVR